MSQELYGKSIDSVSLGFEIFLSSMGVSDKSELDRIESEIMKQSLDRARICVLGGIGGVALIESVLMQIIVVYIALRGVSDIMLQGKKFANRKLYSARRQRESFIMNNITPLIRRSIDSILHHSDTGEKRYADEDIQGALKILEQFFAMNGWKEYFDIAKLQYPYLDAWLK